MKRVSSWAILLLTFLGLADSIYLFRSEIMGAPLLCDLSAVTGCNIVAQSPYSQIFGFPIAGYGVIFYSLLFIVVALELALFHYKTRRIIQGMAVFGLISSVYFVLLQIFVIKALCVYCIASAVLVVLIFMLASTLEPIRVSKAHNTSSPSKSLAMPPSV